MSRKFLSQKRSLFKTSENSPIILESPAFTGLAQRVKSGRGGRAIMRAGLKEVFNHKYKRLLKEFKKKADW